MAYTKGSTLQAALVACLRTLKPDPHSRVITRPYGRTVADPSSTSSSALGPVIKGFVVVCPRRHPERGLRFRAESRRDAEHATRQSREEPAPWIMRRIMRHEDRRWYCAYAQTFLDSPEAVLMGIHICTTQAEIIPAMSERVETLFKRQHLHPARRCRNLEGDTATAE